jgi:transposase
VKRITRIENDLAIREMLAFGYSTAEVAHIFGVSVRTIQRVQAAHRVYAGAA